MRAAAPLLRPTTVPTTTFTYTPAQALILQALRQRYRQDRDLLTACELARLHFVRWLYQTGRLTP